MAAPQVRDLQSLIKTQQAALQPQLSLIDQSITANDQSGQAQVAGLDAAKTQAFGDITQNAQDKGMFFSGFTPDQQAKYTGSTYLPALAQLQSTIAATRSQLLGKKADLNKSAFDVATTQHENDIAAVNEWNKMTAQEKFQADQATKDRVFQAQQNLLNRQATAANAAADRAAPNTAPARKAALSILEKKGVQGRDGKVSPNTFRAAMNAYVGAGGSPEDFRSLYSGYANLAWSPAAYGYA